MECPTCEGRRQVFAFINGGPDIRTHSSGMVQCYTCKGVGSITDAHAASIEVGKRERAARIAAGRGLREEAELRGITITQLSAIENGREVPK